MATLEFEGIRCFRRPQRVELKPITLLVGENSSGKTTFLALNLIASRIAQGRIDADLFNLAPFELGTFDQLASRPTSASRARRTFSISLSGASGSLLATRFGAGGGEAELLEWSLTDSVTKARVARAGDQYTYEIEGPRSTISPVEPGTSEARRLLSPGMLELLYESEPDSDERELGRQDAARFEAARLDLIRRFGKSPYAFAPIRTSPRRTYDPIGGEAKPEGSHIPMMLARLAREGSQDWRRLQATFRQFGRKSGLFSGIEVVRKGKKPSDPFQIAVRVADSPINLMDVGYGVSQVLPILVETSKLDDRHDVFLMQQPEVHLHPQAQAELGSYFVRVRGGRRFVIETHSDYLVDRVRQEIRVGAIPSSEVAVLYFERKGTTASIHEIKLGDDGSIVDAPESYREFFMQEERRILGLD